MDESRRPDRIAIIDRRNFLKIIGTPDDSISDLLMGGLV